MSNKKILQGHNKALESLATIAGIPITKGVDLSSLGITKWEVGSITPSSNTGTGISITHSLGVVPRAMIYYGDTNDSTCVRHGAFIADNKGYVSGGVTYSGGSSATTASGVQWTPTTANLSTGGSYRYLAKGVEYSYILMA